MDRVFSKKKDSLSIVMLDSLALRPSRIKELLLAFRVLVIIRALFMSKETPRCLKPFLMEFSDPFTII